MPLTLEEQERRAYISGDVKTAALLALAIDGDDELSADLQRQEDATRDAEREADRLREDVEALEDRVHELVSELDEIKGLA